MAKVDEQKRRAPQILSCVSQRAWFSSPLKPSRKLKDNGRRNDDFMPDTSAHENQQDEK